MDIIQRVITIISSDLIILGSTNINNFNSQIYETVQRIHSYISRLVSTIVLSDSDTLSLEHGGDQSEKTPAATAADSGVDPTDDIINDFDCDDSSDDCPESEASEASDEDSDSDVDLSADQSCDLQLDKEEHTTGSSGLLRSKLLRCRISNQWELGFY